MSRKTILITAVLIGSALSLAAFPQGRDALLFRVNRPAVTDEAGAVQDALGQFSAGLAGFYVTGGKMAGINIFPADFAVKRSIFQDLEDFTSRGVVLAIDKDKIVLRGLALLDRTHAVAIADERWMTEYQQAGTRKPLGKAPNDIRVRYYLNKKWGKWLVMDYEVYSPEDTVPILDREKVIKKWP